MKIIQSFWTKPFLLSDEFLIDSRMNGGWLHRKYNYYSMTLSALLLRKYYDQVELITDEIGKYILIDKLKLPYTRVVVTLNDLDDQDPGLWALGKIYAYRLQHEPFMHVDNDIFISTPFEQRITTAALMAQNREVISPIYEDAAIHVCKHFEYVPDYLREMVRSETLGCSNAGILGGTDLDFFKTYTDEIFRFIRENQQSIRKFSQTISMAHLNIVYEQFFYYGLSKMYKQEITYLFPNEVNTPPGIAFFHASGRNNGFVHCLGTGKKNRMTYLVMEMKLKSQFPAYYKRVNELVGTIEI